MSKRKEDVVVVLCSDYVVERDHNTRFLAPVTVHSGTDFNFATELCREIGGVASSATT